MGNKSEHKMNRFLVSSLKYIPKNQKSLAFTTRQSNQLVSSSSSPFSTTSTTSTINGPSSSRENEQLIVIGSGVAGCATALIAAQTHKIPVTLLCAGSNPNDCNSYWAQGGIIYRNYDKSSGDSSISLINDVIRAGAGLCDIDAVRKLS